MNPKEKEELDLLAKLEEQNRALLADAKAVPSLNTRRREGSISSSISTESSTDGLKRMFYRNVYLFVYATRKLFLYYHERSLLAYLVAFVP
ncbi:hypothetical protein EG68_01244 [Paragonimus skrjabini miyazakii]|uniref:Uncharacterized protein n=1 Tax=Paragonimus skrjabini miyazakii TaxID=59628 RepID=A0A8S9Z7N6_9TREM|nr:hypothetical protein EG68_01244 [Paragonimus skrjabini miyazakii]